MRQILLGGVIALGLAAPASATPLSDAFSSFWVLGDSLSDNGNLKGTPFAPPAPYFDGRFSNGPVWNEAIAAEFTIGGNLAVGGARTVGGASPSLAAQTLSFGAIPGATLGANPLVSVWAGGNDIRDALSAGDAVTAANNVKASIDSLAGFGVTDFLVLNLPNLGAIPETNGTAGAAAAAGLTTIFNTTLASNNAMLAASGLNIIEVDIFDLFNEVISDPAAFGFSDVEQACVFNPGTCDPATWLFWDNIHPTALGHSLVEARARTAITANISAVPLPASAPLYLFAIVGFAMVRRARS